MKPSLVPFFGLLVATACTSPDRTPQKQHTTARPVVKPAPRRFYWPLDKAVERQDTLLPGPQRYRVQVVTACLNDSAVVNSEADDAGPLLAVSHNYQSDLFVSRGAKPWLHQRLTKALFLGHPVAQRFAPAQEWALSHTAFLAYKQGEFRFYTRLAIPDSDLFVEAEVALTPAQGVRVVSIRPQAEGTEE
jgi:hypothetical protein